MEPNPNNNERNGSNSGNRPNGGKRNDNGNLLIPIYKDTYTNRETTHILYIPVLFENVRITNGSIAHDIGNAQISAPQYFFNNEQTEYAVGYKDLDTLYNDFIKKYETDYKIEKK